MPELPVRKNIRLSGYDYKRNGAYFITICVKNGHRILWSNDVGAAFGRPCFSDIYRPRLSEIGFVIENEIKKIANIYDDVNIDKYVIMPNHIHMIIRLSESEGVDGRPQAAPTISRIINKFKGSITKQIGYSIWQKLFHDRIIRDEEEYQRIWNYIEENPAKWTEDRYYK